MPNFKTILTSSGTRLAEVNIRSGIFQGDSLSPLLFIVAMIPMTRALERMEVGYQLKKGISRIKHLMFMDDIKLFRGVTKEIDTLVQTVRIVSGDIRMEFGIEKYALVNIQRGKATRSDPLCLFVTGTTGDPSPPYPIPLNRTEPKRPSTTSVSGN